MKPFGETSNLLLCLSVCMYTCLSLRFYFILFFFAFYKSCYLFWPILLHGSVCMLFALYIHILFFLFLWGCVFIVEEGREELED